MNNAELIDLFRNVERSNYPVCNGCPMKYTCDKNQITRCLFGTAADALEAAEKRIAELERILKAVQENSGINFRLWQEAEVQMQKEGEWIEVHDWLHIPQEERGTYRCSACGQVMKYPWNYCPNCGARMKGIQK